MFTESLKAPLDAYTEVIFEDDGSRPVAIVDIDDVLADFPEVFLRYLMDLTGRPWNLSSGQYGLEASVVEKFGPEKGNDIISDFYNDRKARYLTKLRSIPGAKEYIRYLKNRGYYLHAVTGRPARMFEGVVEDTLQWLARNDFQFDTVSFTRKKGELVHWYYGKDLKPAIAVEDNLDFAKQLSPYVDKVYLRNRHYNYKSEEIPANIERFWEFEELY